MRAQKTRWILIIGAFVLFVLLFISPRQKANADSSNEPGSASPSSTTAPSKREAMDVYFNLAFNNLASELKMQHDRLKAKGHSDSLVTFWDQQKRPDLAAYFTEVVAEKTDSAAAWYKAGNRYYYAIPFIKDESELPLLYQRAASCYENSLKQDSSNTDAKIMLAACMVEGSADPMKGISLLRSIELKDSNNVKLQMTFALFSVKSGQLDKAVLRFNKVLQIDSTAIEVYLHLADVYEKLGKPENSLKMLENYQSKTNDPMVKLEIGKYIDQLRKSN